MQEEAIKIKVIPWTMEEYFEKRKERIKLRDLMEVTSFWRPLRDKIKELDLALELHERLFPGHEVDYLTLGLHKKKQK